MKDVLLFVWRVVRYFKPIRTFWLTASGLLAVTAGIDAGTVGLTQIDWLTVLSGSATAAVFNFIVLMGGGDSFWSEPKGNTEVIKGKPQVNSTEAPAKSDGPRHSTETN
jgi:hypothetical protein